MTPESLPILYSFRRCPYAMRARLALQESRQVCRLREVVLREKPAEMLAVSPKGTVPVLVLPEGDVIDESLDIMYWALSTHDPENWLQNGTGQRARPEWEALIARFDTGFKHHLDRYKYASRYEGAEASDHRREGATYLDELNTRLGRHQHLLDDQACIADFAIFPFVRQFANTDRSWFDQQPWPNLQRWLEGHLASDRFRRIMKKYPKWNDGDVEPLFGQAGPLSGAQG